MIPEFPEFKKLELSDKADVEAFTHKYPPYSDFNFVSMYSWNVQEKMEISQLNGNLVVKFTDYLTGEPFFSFLGNNKTTETAKSLLDLSSENGFAAKLKLIPEISLEGLDKEKFLIEEDLDNHDYILSTKDMASMEGSDFSKKRNVVSKFKKTHEHRTESLDLNDGKSLEILRKLFLEWIEQKDMAPEETEFEYKAFCRFLEIANHSDLHTTHIQVGESPAAFWVNENLGNKYAMSHFEKAKMNSFFGIYPHLQQQTAHVLLENGIEYINLEQDLGILGLRESKRGYRPCGYLKKYIIRLRT